MYNFAGFLDDLTRNSGVKFNLMDDNGNQIFKSFEYSEGMPVVYVPMILGGKKVVLNIPKENETCTSLLKYVIENKFKELLSKREQFLTDILDGKEVAENMTAKYLPYLEKGYSLFVMSINKNKNEALNVIKQMYTGEEILGIIYKDDIVVMGIFDEPYEHIKSIREALVSEIYSETKIGMGCMVKDIDTIAKSYKEAHESLCLGRDFEVKGDIYIYRKMLFEKIVHNVNPDLKEEFVLKIRDKFDSFDSEMITTIEEFMNSGLNISDAARKLYIHRNTLIYRIDKIYKETGFDIRDFKEAAVFNAAFLIWKEKR